jgi:hypothetical protein
MSGMDETTASRASHAAYVKAVVAALAELDLTATDLSLEISPLRRAEMTIVEEHPAATHWQGREWVRLRWDERHGWSWQVRYEGDAQPRAAVHFGLTAVPKPTAVADWMLISLGVPHATPSREDGPFTTPDLDAVLRAYAAT